MFFSPLPRKLLFDGSPPFVFTGGGFTSVKLITMPPNSQLNYPNVSLLHKGYEGSKAIYNRLNIFAICSLLNPSYLLCELHIGSQVGFSVSSDTLGLQ